MNRRVPADYRPVTCVGADGREYGGLCYSPRRGEIIEPITNKAAEPVIGPIRSWYYEEEADD